MNKIAGFFLTLGLSIIIIRCGSSKKISAFQLSLNTETTIPAIILKKITPTGDMVPVDTLFLKNGKTIYSYYVSSPDLYFLSYKNKHIPFILENKNTYIQVDSLFRLKKIEGGEENLLMQNYIHYRDSILQIENNLYALSPQSKDLSKDQKDKKQRLLAQEFQEYQYHFVQHHPSLSGIYVLLEMSFDKKNAIKKLFDIYQQYPENIKKTNAGKFLTKRLNDLSVGALGMRMQNFTAPTPEGKIISLFSIMGKVTIIDFWASWCRPCRAQNPHLKKIYQQYHDKGLNIISVSLDHNKKAWLKAIKDDDMPWYHVSHLKGWKEPVAQQFHVRFIPQTFIIDKKGILRYKNLRGKLLEQKVTQLLEE